jgi:hypothetical protein
VGLVKLTFRKNVSLPSSVERREERAGSLLVQLTFSM